MRPEAPRLGSELDAMARLGLANGQGDPVARMAAHAEAAMAEAWNEALAHAMGGPESHLEAPRPQPPARPSGEGVAYGAQGPIRPPNPSPTSSPPTNGAVVGSAIPMGGANPAMAQLWPPGMIPPLGMAGGMPMVPPGMAAAFPQGLAGAYPPGLPPGVNPYAGLPPGMNPYANLPPGMAPGYAYGMPLGLASPYPYGALPPGMAIGATAAPRGVASAGLGPELQALIEEKAAKHGVPAWLVKQVVMAESGGNAKAVSPVGAQGLMQLMPETANELGVTNPFDPSDNVDGGVRYLKRMMDAFGGDLPKAVAAYNAGPGAVARYGGVPPYAETRAYVRRILGDQG